MEEKGKERKNQGMQYKGVIAQKSWHYYECMIRALRGCVVPSPGAGALLEQVGSINSDRGRGGGGRRR